MLVFCFTLLIVFSPQGIKEMRTVGGKKQDPKSQKSKPTDEIIDA